MLENSGTFADYKIVLVANGAVVVGQFIRQAGCRQVTFSPIWFVARLTGDLIALLASKHLANSGT